MGDATGSQAMMHVVRCEQANAGVMVLEVVPIEEIDAGAARIFE